MLLLVPFVDTMTTMLNEKLPLTPAEWELWGNPIKSKEYFEYILSYSPYNNLKKNNYPSMLITTSLFDNRVLYSEPVKYIAKLRDTKTDNNTQLLKCKMGSDVLKLERRLKKMSTFKDHSTGIRVERGVGI